MQPNDFHPASLLRIDAVERLTSLSRSSIYRLIARCSFPAPVKLGKRCTRWRAGDVIAWLEATRWNCQLDNSVEQPIAEICQVGKSAVARMTRIAYTATRRAHLHQLGLPLPCAEIATDPGGRVVEVVDAIEPGQG